MSERSVLIFGCLMALAFSPSATADDFADRSTPAPLKFISFDVPRAYPGLPYTTRMAVLGGDCPYTFVLVKGPDGAQMTPDRGEVLWTPKREDESAAFEVKMTDASGKSVTKSWTVKVTKAGFHFVSPTGDDNGDGSLEKPWKTVQHAINQARGTGTIYLREGVYRERSRPKDSPGGYDEYSLLVGLAMYDLHHQQPTARNPFVLASYPGEHAVVEPGAEDVTGIQVMSPYVVIQDLELRNHRQTALSVANFGVVRGCEIHAVRGTTSNCQAIYAPHGADEFVLQDCHLYDVRQPAMPTHANGVCLYRIHDGLFEDNHVHDCDSNGMIDKDGGRGNEFRGNVVHDCGTGIFVMGQSQHHDIRIYDNLVYGCRVNDTEPGGGIRVGNHEHGVFSTRVHHNTVIGGLAISRATDTTVWNCVFQTPGRMVSGVNPADSPKLMLRRCVFFATSQTPFKFGPWWQTPAISAPAYFEKAEAKDVLFRKVEFLDAAHHDYRLKMTRELDALVGPAGRLGADDRVLRWAADGCSARVRLH